jgi:hypothetical protein
MGVVFAGFFFDGGTAGNINLQWAQNTSDLGALKLLKGSFLHIARLVAEMATLSGFTRPPNPIGPDLGPKIQTGIGKTVTDASASPTDVFVTGPNLVTGDKSAIQTVLNGYVYEPDFFLVLEAKNLRNVVSTLRNWAAAAHTESTAWAGQTQAQRDAAMATTFDRLGTFFDRFADAITVLGFN